VRSGVKKMKGMRKTDENHRRLGLVEVAHVAEPFVVGEVTLRETVTRCATRKPLDISTVRGETKKRRKKEVQNAQV
jgi:hypothetical protein